MTDNHAFSDDVSPAPEKLGAPPDDHRHVDNGEAKATGPEMKKQTLRQRKPLWYCAHIAKWPKLSFGK